MVEERAPSEPSLVQALEHQEGVEVVAAARGGADTTAQIRTLKPDIVVIDISTPSVDGLETLFQIKLDHLHPRVIIVSRYTHEEYVKRVMQAGASAYVHYATVHEDLPLAVKAVSSGEHFFSSSIAKLILHIYLRQSPTLNDPHGSPNT